MCEYLPAWPSGELKKYLWSSIMIALWVLEVPVSIPPIGTYPMFVLTPMRQSLRLPLNLHPRLQLLAPSFHRPLPTSRQPSRSVRSACHCGYLLLCTLCLYFLFLEKGCCSCSPIFLNRISFPQPGSQMLRRRLRYL